MSTYVIVALLLLLYSLLTSLLLVSSHLMTEDGDSFWRGIEGGTSKHASGGAISVSVNGLNDETEREGFLWHVTDFVLLKSSSKLHNDPPGLFVVDETQFSSKIIETFDILPTHIQHCK